LPDWQFHDEFLWATTLALRDGCKLGEKLGANPNLLREARQLTDVLDLALERKYKGVTEELKLLECTTPYNFGEAELTSVGRLWLEKMLDGIDKGKKGI